MQNDEPEMDYNIYLTDEEADEYFDKCRFEAQPGDRVLAHRVKYEITPRERVFLYLNKNGFPVCQTIDEWEDLSTNCEIFDEVELITETEIKFNYRTKKLPYKKGDGIRYRADEDD
jgi:hypothetical protein